MRGTLFFLFLSLFPFLNGFSQGIAIDQWRDHLPYHDCINVCEANNTIYGATNNAILYVPLGEETAYKLSKMNGLSDVGITAMNAYNNTVVVGYTNANIDLITANGIVNISDLKRKNILGDKKIYEIKFQGNYAYLACGFGIVIVDLVKQEIKDSYLFKTAEGDIQVNDLAFKNDTIYAATNNGVYLGAMKTSNLADFNKWVKMTSLPSPNANYNAIAALNTFIVVNKQSSEYNKDTLLYFNQMTWKPLDSLYFLDVYALKSQNSRLIVTCNLQVRTYDVNLQQESLVYTYPQATSFNTRDAIFGSDGYLWMADYTNGLIKYHGANTKQFLVNGPGYTNNYKIRSYKDQIWVTSGGLNDAYNNTWSTKGVYSFINEKWTTYDTKNVPIISKLRDFIDIAVDDQHPEKVYIATYYRGLLELTNGVQTGMYLDTNSTLKPGPTWYSIALGGVIQDQDYNVWMTNSVTKDILSVKKADGSWKAFTPIFSDNYDIANHTLGNIIITQSGKKWMILHKGGGLLVFDDNKTIDNTTDDQWKRLTNEVGQGNLISMTIFSIAEDMDGNIWVGTDDGLLVFYSPNNVFTNKNFDAQELVVEKEGYTQTLLDNEVVTAITIDAANRKWIGTKSGVFVLSADGKTELLHFNAENSPLLSDAVNSIAINHQTGEIFIGTDKGVASFKYTATEGQETHVKSAVYAYPNPVRPTYTGKIAIKNLVTNAQVKITDMAGNVIYSAIADGGQVVWDGLNFEGNKPQSGVYLVFSTNENGSDTIVTKLVIVQ